MLIQGDRGQTGRSLLAQAPNWESKRVGCVCSSERDGRWAMGDDGRWAIDGNGATATATATRRRRRRRPKATAPPVAAPLHTLPIRHRRPPLLPLSALASLRARPLADTAVSRAFALRRGGALVTRGLGAAFHPWPRGTRRGYVVVAALVLLQLFRCSCHRSTARTRPFSSPRARCSGMEPRGLRLLQQDRQW